MAIITIANLKASFDSRRVDQLADDGNDTITANIQAAIDDADGEVKNALSSQYTTAQIEADPGIKRLTKVFAMWNLEFRRGNIPELLQQAYDRMQATLERLQEGKHKLNAVSQVLPRISPTAATDVFRVQADDGYFVGLLDIE